MATLDAREAALLDYMRAHPDGEATVSEMANAVRDPEGPGRMPSTAILRRLRRLAHKGFVEDMGLVGGKRKWRLR
jgi:hypothetical protein